MAKKYFWLALVLLWMGVIFLLSTDSFSSPHSLSVLARVWGWLWPRSSTAFLEALNWLARKGAHITVYLVLFLLTVKTFDHWRGNSRANPYYALIFTVFYALTDEFHQTFVPSRTSAPMDILWDTLGGLIGLGIYYLNKGSKVRGTDDSRGENTRQ